MKNFILFIVLFLHPVILFAQNDTLVARIVLIGDAGELDESGHHKVIEAIGRNQKIDSNTIVLFLGDNIYPEGLPRDQDANYEKMRAILDTQANITRLGPKMVYFIPGNHDWMNNQFGGWDAVRRQQRYIDSLRRPNLRFLPRGGCPGPEVVRVSKDVILVIMDTEWWLQTGIKPGIESTCENKNRLEVLADLQDIVNSNTNKLILFAAHHPFRSNGIHGGYFTLKQHVFPFTDMEKNLYIPMPILGSVYPISRNVFGSLQDLKHPEYTNMINAIDDILKLHPNVIHLAGHEHCMEWISDSTEHFITVGSGSKSTRVSKSKEARFVSESLGWGTLEIFKDKTLRGTFYGANTDNSGRVLYQSEHISFVTPPDEAQPDTSSVLSQQHDSVLVPVNAQYEQAGKAQRFLVGNNYRDVWGQPVLLKEFKIKKAHGGFQITGMGGGFQTKNLKLEDSQHRRWNLRTINKDPQRVLPESLRETFARDLVQDMISAAHPFSPLAVAGMAEAAGIAAPDPEFYYVPDDKSLGRYRPYFSNKVCLLEEHDPTIDGSVTKSSDKVIEKRIASPDHFADQHAVLQARLLDMLVGDWDRHLDQWRWGLKAAGHDSVYYPIPRDRDQAFFRSDGFIMLLATSRIIPWMAGFNEHLKKFNWLSHSPRNFDRFFLNEMDRSDWEAGIQRFQNAITDSVIHKSIQRMPEQIVALDGAEIEHKLKSRRTELGNKGISYYKFLSKSVNVHGTNRRERFELLRSDTGLVVQVTSAGTDGGFLYQRTFDPKVTKEIRLYGFNGNDYFHIDPAVFSSIRVRMIGGAGVDTFNIEGRAHTRLYDLKQENNYLMAQRHAYNKFSKNAQVNDYKVQDFEYDFWRVPILAVGYNADDGPLLGLGAWRRTFGFRKQPYESDNRLAALIAFEREAYQVRYNGVFNQCIGQFDFKLFGNLQLPALRNFFGYGNETEASEDLSYYRARFDMVTAEAAIQKRAWNLLTVGVGSTYNFYSARQYTNEGKVLEYPTDIGLDSTSVYTDKVYVGGKFYFQLNNINNELFPTRGINWLTEANFSSGVLNDAKPYSEIHSDFDLYASLKDPARLVAVLRMGGGHILSKDFEYFQSMSLGQNNYLRGFRRNRFSGRSMAYGSLEMRAKLLYVRSYILPGAFGLVGFTDIARVWQDGEDSRKWHDSYGGGVFFIPFNMFILSATVAFSEEEPLMNVTFGTKLNVTL